MSVFINDDMITASSVTIGLSSNVASLACLLAQAAEDKSGVYREAAIRELSAISGTINRVAELVSAADAERAA